MNKHFPLIVLAAWAGLARAHEGHGLPGLSHWHAGDVGTLLALVAAIGLGLWLSRRK
jgi:hypothetical protein